MKHKNLLISLVIIFLFFNIGIITIPNSANSFVNQNNPKTNHSGTGIIDTNISVSAQLPETPTGIYVSQGDTIHINTSGNWCWGGAIDECSGPGGTPGRPHPDEHPVTLEPLFFGVPIGKINNTYFEIGFSTDYVADSSGYLYLLMNDRVGSYGDNSGYMNFHVVKSFPQVEESIDPFLSAPAAQHLNLMPVVIIRYLPTIDGINLNYDATGISSTLSSMESKINMMNNQIKFSLEEGSRFRGYNNPAAIPSLGYQVVYYVTVYEDIPRSSFQVPWNPSVYRPDYEAILNRFNAQYFVEQLGVKEFWIWGYHHGLIEPAESNMSSPVTGDISNSERRNDDLPVYNKTYVLYNYNYGRFQAEAVHNHGHQLEAILTHVDQIQNNNTELFQDKFIGKLNGTHITGRCGWTHMPPNTTIDYDYINYTQVQSDIEDWTPDRTGILKLVNANTWGNIIYNWPYFQIPAAQIESHWYIYWFQNMPGFGNNIQYDEQNYMNNWWKFTANWDSCIVNNVGLYGLRLNTNLSADLKFLGNSSGDALGTSVSNAGDVNNDGYDDVIVGAPGYNSQQGRAYIYYGGMTMNNTANVTLTGETAGNSYGKSVSSAGDVNGDGYDDIIVGAYNYLNSKGRVYIYFGGANMNNVADVILEGESVNSAFGYSVSDAGDLNNDGFSDVIVGAYSYNNSAGKAYVYYGGSNMNNVVDLTFTGVTASGIFGFSVSKAGDFNNDNYDDVIISAPNNVTQGKAYIYFGGQNMNNTEDVVLNGEGASGMFGYSVSTAGDINNDGFDDVIAGDIYLNGNGRAYIYFGNNSLNSSPDVFLNGENSSFLGTSVSCAGDINNDGFSDVIVGAFGFDNAKGKTYIYYGGYQMDSSVDLFVNGSASYDYLGYSVSTAGDCNSDGFSDIVVGAFGNDEAGNDAGASYLFLSSVSKITVDLTALIQGFYNEFQNIMISDTIKAYLRNSISPFSLIDSSTTLINSSGRGTLRFYNAPSGTYYLVLKHRNSIETWNKIGGHMFTSGSTVTPYDFTSSITQAYGSNMILKGTKYCIYNGDVNQDGNVNLSDIVLTYNSASTFANGYLETDLNGDNITNLTDILLGYNNSTVFVSVMKP